MPSGPSTRRTALRRGSGPTEQVAELKELVVGYAKQETVGPLRNLGRYLGFGIAGSVAIGAGVVFLLLALLRGLQRLAFLSDPDRFEGGRLAWAPYLIVMVVGIAVAVAFLRTLLNMSKKGRP